MSQTFQVSCPCECGEEVTATDEGFQATSVEVAACSTASARGVASWTLRKTAAYERAVMSAFDPEAIVASANRTPRVPQPICVGSYGLGDNGRFPGDSDRCPVCMRLVRVLESNVLAKHRVPKTSRRALYN